MSNVDDEDWPAGRGVGPVLDDAFLGDAPAAASKAVPSDEDFLRSNGAILYDSGLFDLFIAEALERFLEDKALREAAAHAITEDLREHYPGVLETFNAVVSAASSSENLPRPLCEPEDGIVPYLGKRNSGPIDEFLRHAYPFRPGAPRLTLQTLGMRDPHAYRALYNQLDESGREKLGLPKTAREGDELLATMGIDLATEEGLRTAKRLYGLLSSRLYPRRRLELPPPS